jgi:hypothetical protein
MAWPRISRVKRSIQFGEFILCRTLIRPIIATWHRTDAAHHRFRDTPPWYHILVVMRLIAHATFLLSARPWHSGQICDETSSFLEIISGRFSIRTPLALVVWRRGDCNTEVVIMWAYYPPLADIMNIVDDVELQVGVLTPNVLNDFIVG